MLAATSDGPSLLGAIGRLPSPTPESTNNPGGLFSGNPSIRTDGLFPYSFGSAPSLASPFQRGFLPANGHARPMPGTPGAPATLGLPASNSPLPPPAQSQTSPAASVSSFDPLNGSPASSPVGMPAPAAPKRSVLFTHPPPFGIRPRSIARRRTWIKPTRAWPFPACRYRSLAPRSFRRGRSFQSLRNNGSMR